MADDPNGARARAEPKFSKAQRTTDEARAVTDSEIEATRKKTARLKAERLARSVIIEVTPTTRAQRSLDLGGMLARETCQKIGRRTLPFALDMAHRGRPGAASWTREIAELIDAAAPKPGRPATY